MPPYPHSAVMCNLRETWKGRESYSRRNTFAVSRAMYMDLSTYNLI